jgi:RNA polymerase primary sigma factor
MKEQEISTTQYSSSWHISTDALLPGQDTTTMMDILHNPDDTKPDDALMLDSLRTEINRVLATLSDKEKSILIHYYGIAGRQAMSLEELSKKYDISTERVRQIKEKAIKKLRSSARSKHLLTFL